MKEDNKTYLRALLQLRATIDARIDNEITEGILRERPDINGLAESLKYKIDDFMNFNK